MRVEPFKSKPRLKSHTYVCKRLSLNVNLRERPYKMSGRSFWKKLQGYSRSRARVIPNSFSPWVHEHGFRQTKRAFTPKLTKYRKPTTQIKHQFKRTYGIPTERKLKKIFRHSSSAKLGGEHILSLLERRVDSVVYRAGFAATITQANRWVRNGWIQVGGVTVRSPHSRVKLGAVVGVSYRVWNAVYERMVWRVRFGSFTNPAPWLLVDYNTMVAMPYKMPVSGDMSFSHPVDMSVIDTMYSSAKRAGHRNIQ